tara:strand:- start:112 stop:561 length:450 start_codon:yes stop_codon:yes gene_type:complete
MRNLAKYISIFLIFNSCITNESHYGEIITNENIINYSSAKELVIEKGKISTKIKGVILETCAKKGCWMRLQADNDTLFIRFKDYGFFVPTSGLEGKTAIVQGEATYETLDVEEVRHYAEDAGKSIEEIELITEPEYIFSFTANGVIIQD